ncbi:MAG: hypothetical protein ACFFCV_21655 [Promethearchaeota archaeon]
MAYQNKIQGVGFKNLAPKLFLCGLFIATLLISSINYKDMYPENLDCKNDSLNLNDNEIIINTPENKTYLKPMNGYYPASYGFENDEYGSDPEGWGIDEENGDCSIVEFVDDHKNVMKIDSNSSGRVRMHQLFDTDKTFGIIELWVRMETSSSDMYVKIHETWSDAVHLALTSNMFYRYYDGSWYNIMTYDVNRWYHLKIKFDCGASGDGSNDWHLWIDGEEKSPLGGYNFRGSPVLMNSLFISAESISTTCYADAIGYSWDPTYKIGENMNEGLLLSFNKVFTEDWLGYSLNGQSNKTIQGNKTIPFPKKDGVNTIQVFGNDTIGTMYKSDIRYFTTEIFNIITPENKTYTTSMIGYYPATYGFENDVLGGDAMNWTHDVVTSTHSEIIDSYKGHKRVYELFDNAAGNPDTYTTFNNQSYGTIELWVLVTIEQPAWIEIREEFSERILVCMIPSPGNPLLVRIGAVDTYLTEFGILSADEWYHLRIDFRITGAPEYMGLSEDSFIVYLNSIKSNSEISMEYTSVQANKFLLTTTYSVADPNYYLYFDAVGFSWDPNYNIGDNLNEGLLLSFNTAFTPDWLAYSLDNQINNTILGNKTIPFPTTDGFHTIQVFGNDNIGTIYESDIRYFSIDTIAPVISGSDNLIELDQYSYHSLDWTINEIFGGTYVIFKNSSIESAGTYQNNNVVSIIVDATKLGYLNYTIIARDLTGKTNSHTVIVKIIPQKQEPPIIPGFNLLFLFSIVIMTTGVIIKIKFKKTTKKFF